VIDIRHDNNDERRNGEERSDAVVERVEEPDGTAEDEGCIIEDVNDVESVVLRNWLFAVCVTRLEGLLYF
jgi:hypothetical protein